MKVKALLDTNVLISAFLTDGICARLLRRARNGEYRFVLCTPVLEEFQRILKDKFRFDDNEIAFFSAIVSETASEIHQLRNPVAGICRDADDAAILVCATEAETHFLVTGDDDLLISECYEKKNILRPRDFEILFED